MPSLAKIRRPSKSAIVNGSIDHLSLQRNHRLSAARELRRMFSEKQELLAEVNEWRGRNGMSHRESTGWTRDLEELLSVEAEVFGQFTGMGNGDGDGDGEGEGEGDADGEGEVQDYHLKQSVEASGVETPIEALRSGSFADGISMDGSALRRDSLHPSLPTDPYASSSLHSSLMGPDAFSQARFTMPVRQKSFAPTELSSVLSGSPPQLTQAFGNGSPIGSTQHLALQAFLSGGDAFAHGPSLESPGGLSGDCITPPSHDLHIDVNTFAPPSPPTAATSFASAGTDQDKVSQWAAQQVMLQYVQDSQHMSNARSGKNVASMDIEFSNPFPSYNPASRLDAAHQALLTHQPQLAAAAFPPPYADTLFGSSGSHSNESSGHGDHFGPTAAALASNSQFQQFFAANPSAVASLNPALDGMTYGQIEQWSRFGQITSRSPRHGNNGVVGQPENLDDFRQAVRAGINMGLAAGMVRSS